MVVELINEINEAQGIELVFNRGKLLNEDGAECLGKLKIVHGMKLAQHLQKFIGSKVGFFASLFYMVI